jgi:hypothetical protein
VMPNCSSEASSSTIAQAGIRMAPHLQHRRRNRARDAKLAAIAPRGDG